MTSDRASGERQAAVIFGEGSGTDGFVFEQQQAAGCALVIDEPESDIDVLQGKQLPSLPDDGGRNRQADGIDQTGCDQSAGKLGAAVDLQLPARLLLERVDRLHRIPAKYRRGIPGTLGERFGNDVLRQ